MSKHREKWMPIGVFTPKERKRIAALTRPREPISGRKGWVGAATVRTADAKPA